MAGEMLRGLSSTGLRSCTRVGFGRRHLRVNVGDTDVPHAGLFALAPAFPDAQEDHVPGIDGADAVHLDVFHEPPIDGRKGDGRAEGVEYGDVFDGKVPESPRRPFRT